MSESLAPLQRHSEYASAQIAERLSKMLDRADKGRRIHELVDVYLSPRHAAHPEQGCPVAALGAEVARGDGSRSLIATGSFTPRSTATTT